MKWIILSAVSLVCWVALYLYIYLGLSKPVHVELKTSPELVLVFKKHLGAYHKVNETIEDVENRFKKEGLQCPQTFGEYPDDPEKISEDRLVSYVGCVFKEPAAALKALAKKNDLQYEVRTPRKAIVATFAGSPAVGPMKVYPKIDALIQDQRLVRSSALMEIYEVQGDHVLTTYLQPVQ
jgi:hypothetical protein